MKTRVMNLWEWATDLILLNILWFVCCIPLFTIGAASAALWGVMLQRVRKEDIFSARDFFRSFKRNFKRASQVWGILAAAELLLMVNFVICHTFQELRVLELVFLILLLCLIGFSQYLFPLVSQGNKSWRESLKTAMIMAAYYLPQTFLVTSIALIPVIAAVVVQYAMLGVLLGITFTTAFSTWLNARILCPIISANTQSADP